MDFRESTARKGGKGGGLVVISIGINLIRVKYSHVTRDNPSLFSQV